MKKFAAIAAFLICSLATANAQTFLEHLQDKQGKGTVTVKQSKAIDDLVNGKNTPQVEKTVPAVSNNEKKKEPVTPTHAQATPNTHHNEQARTQENKQKADSAKHAQQQREREEAKKQEAKHQTSVDNNEEIEVPAIDTRKKVMRNSRKVDGYRVQAFAGGNSRDDRNKAQSIGNNIKQHFPSEPIYVHFYSPRWICRVGNYRSFAEASAMLKELKKLGYKSACIVKGKITVQY